MKSRRTIFLVLSLSLGALLFGAFFPLKRISHLRISELLDAPGHADRIDRHPGNRNFSGAVPPLWMHELRFQGAPLQIDACCFYDQKTAREAVSELPAIPGFALGDQAWEYPATSASHGRQDLLVFRRANVVLWISAPVGHSAKLHAAARQIDAALLARSPGVIVDTVPAARHIWESYLRKELQELQSELRRRLYSLLYSLGL